MSELRIAVFGGGRMGALRAHAAQQWGARVCTVVDADPGRARALAAILPGCHARAATDRFDWSAHDAVFVCTPPAERSAAQQAVAHRLPTFIEKPVGIDAAAAAALAASAAEAGVLTAVGYMNRYRPSVQRLREWLAGETVLGASAHWINAAYSVPWWAKVAESGGSLNEQATHFIDLLRHLLGDPVRVHTQASGLPGHPGVVGNAVLSLGFSNDAVASLAYSCRANVKAIGLRVFTAGGEAVLQDWDLRLTRLGSELTNDPPPTDRNAIFGLETGAFLSAVVAGRPAGILCDLADAVRTQRVVDAALRSQARGDSQNIAYDAGPSGSSRCSATPTHGDPS